MLPAILHQDIIPLRISKGNQNFSKNSAVCFQISGKILPTAFFPVQLYSVPLVPLLFCREAKKLFFVVTLQSGPGVSLRPRLSPFAARFSALLL